MNFTAESGGGGGGGGGGGFVGRKMGEKSNFSVTCSRLSQLLKVKSGFGDVGLGTARSFDAKAHQPGNPLIINLLQGVINSQQAPKSSTGVTIPTPKLPDLNDSKPMDFYPEQIHIEPPVLPSDSVENPLPQPSQMTIFYGGKVFVFDNLPLDKVQELVKMADMENPNSSPPQNPSSIPDRLNCPPPQNVFATSTLPSNNLSAITTCNAVKPTAITNSSNVASPITMPNASNVATPIAITTSSNVATTSEAPQDRSQRPVHPQNALDLPIARRVSLNRFLERRKGRINSKAPYQVDGSSDIGSSSSGASKEIGDDEFPCFSKPDVSMTSSGKMPIGKPEQTAMDLTYQNTEQIAKESNFGKPENSPNLLAFRKPEETTIVPVFRKPEEKTSWLGLATPSSSDMSEFDLRR